MAKSKKKKGNVANEPVVKYGNLVFFNSFEQQKEYEVQEVLKQSPVERIKETVDLILRMYGFTRETLKNRRPDNTIYFDKTE